MNDTSQSAPPSPGHIEIARESRAVLLRVIGIGNMNISLTMADFVDESLKEGFRHFALDLGPCRGMDSTFMGTIIGMHRRIADEDGWLCMLNVSPQSHHLLDMVGVGRFVTSKDDFPLEAVETECLMPDRDPMRRLKHIRKAHEHLVDIDERNRERFGRFLQKLDEEMADQGESPPEDADAEKSETDASGEPGSPQPPEEEPPPERPDDASGTP